MAATPSEGSRVLRKVTLQSPPGNKERLLCPKSTPQQLLQLGKFRMMYITRTVHDGQRALALHGAHGASYVTTSSVDEAAQLVAELGLFVVAVH